MPNKTCNMCGMKIEKLVYYSINVGGQLVHKAYMCDECAKEVFRGFVVKVGSN